MTGALSGARVLVTRPQKQAHTLCRLIEAAGGIVHAVPVLEILPAAEPDRVLQAIGNVDDYDLLVFVSTNAVHYGRDYLPADRAPRGRIAAIGPTTARQLETCGLGCDIRATGGGYASENLLHEAALADMTGQRVLILRGGTGRLLLGDTLRERGAVVTYADVYRRQPPEASTILIRDLIDRDAVDIASATSVETLCNIVDMAGPERQDKLWKITLLTASPRVVKRAAESGFERPTILAGGPDDASLVSALKVFWTDTAPDRAADNNHDVPDSGLETHAMASDTTGKDDAAKKQAGPDDDGTESVGKRVAPADDGAPPKVAPDASPAAPPESAPDSPADVPHEAPLTTQPAPNPTAPPLVVPARPVKSGRGLAALALLLALVGIGGAAWNWWQLQGTHGAIDDIAAGIPDVAPLLDAAQRENRAASDALATEVDRKLARVDLSAVEVIKDEQATLNNRLRGQERNVSTLTNRLSGLEEDLSAMQGVSASVRNTWVRAEAEYFLQTANSRLLLARDVESALQALRAADERIGALGDPGLTPVRAKLTEEILAVESVPRPDVEGMALLLNGMTGRIGELPIRSRAPTNYGLAAPGEEDDSLTGFQRARQSVAEVFTGIVRVSPTTGNSVELLAPEEIYFLNRNLELQLQVARLALMQGDQENFSGSLATAAGWLREHFDVEDQGVATLLTRLDEMQQTSISPALPDISGSLRLLREIVAASGTSS